MGKQPIADIIKSDNGALRIGIVALAATALFTFGTQFDKFVGRSHYTKEECFEKFVCREEYDKALARIDRMLRDYQVDVQAQLTRMETRLMVAFYSANPAATSPPPTGVGP